MRQIEFDMVPSMFNTLRTVISLAVLILVWAVLAMMVFDRFPPPFNLIESWLLPWEDWTRAAEEVSIEGSLAIMQEVLDSSHRVAQGALTLMASSFFFLTVYATFVYQQRQRRMRENELLMMKNREIARRNEFIRYISATISHEFKNNLSNVKRRLDLMDLPAEPKERLDSTLEKLFTDITIFKKISDEREAALMEYSRVNLLNMFSNFQKQYAGLADVVIDDSGYAPRIFASHTLLHTVFDIIIDNAVKYRKPGQERAKVFISCSPDADGTRQYVSISIRDEGVGMDEHLADEVFYQKSDSEEGWGMGMMFAKYAIGLHAGKIRIGKEYTAPGVGTEVIIKLPHVEESLRV